MYRRCCWESWGYPPQIVYGNSLHEILLKECGNSWIRDLYRKMCPHKNRKFFSYSHKVSYYFKNDTLLEAVKPLIINGTFTQKRKQNFLRKLCRENDYENFKKLLDLMIDNDHVFGKGYKSLLNLACLARNQNIPIYLFDMYPFIDNLEGCDKLPPIDYNQLALHCVSSKAYPMLKHLWNTSKDKIDINWKNNIFFDFTIREDTIDMMTWLLSINKKDIYLDLHKNSILFLTENKDPKLNAKIIKFIIKMTFSLRRYYSTYQYFRRNKNIENKDAYRYSCRRLYDIYGKVITYEYRIYMMKYRKFVRTTQLGKSR
jgi:hypothetical protein